MCSFWSQLWKFLLGENSIILNYQNVLPFTKYFPHLPISTWTDNTFLPSDICRNFSSSLILWIGWSPLSCTLMTLSISLSHTCCSCNGGAFSPLGCKLYGQWDRVCLVCHRVLNDKHNAWHLSNLQ